MSSNSNGMTCVDFPIDFVIDPDWSIGPYYWSIPEHIEDDLSVFPFYFVQVVEFSISVEVVLIIDFVVLLDLIGSIHYRT